MTIKIAQPSVSAAKVPPQPPPPPPPPHQPPDSPQSEKPSENMGPVWIILALIGFLIAVLCAAAGGYNYIPFFLSLTSLIWAIYVTVWIKKIKDRHTEAVLVQTMSLQALQEILEQIKKQNV